MNAEMRDREARRRALNPRDSFIVQAPAGSGKTELLIQRFLTLLTTVRQPEQVVAITFTRKAAAEMRHRVIQALRAATGRAMAPEPQRAETLEIARAVLARDAEHGWSLLSQPQRIRIDTLDALNAWLAQQLPILAGGVAGASLEEDPIRLYALAAQRLLDRLFERGPLASSLARLLAIANNASAQLETLLANLLPTRDQWMRYLLGAGQHELRTVLERGLDSLIANRLERVTAGLDADKRSALAALLAHAALHATRPAAQAAFEIWRRLDAFPERGSDALEAWRAAASLLLTSTGRWRSQLTKGEGFGPDHPEPRARLARLLEELGAAEQLREALLDVLRLPEPRYSERQLQDLEALRIVLRNLVAELRIVFAEHGSVDFVELAMAAEQALGRTDDPSGLLLALDQRIEHLLVDEFQDTSHAQLRLLELLTAGWVAGDGRTLFLVGDPMQSIYRFRDADMALFLRAKHHGIGGVSLELLVLESNFRSAPAVVDWINRVFSQVFPREDQIDRGLARFYPCLPAREAAGSQRVELHALEASSDDAEISEIAAILQSERTRSASQRIAILVQSRSHLAGLQSTLRERGIEAQAVEIESLRETEIGQDLIGLTRALVHHADRIAWLAVLRAPWCGLRWADLERLCRDADSATVPELLHDPRRLASLSADGRHRAVALRATLDAADRARGRYSFSRWIEQSWVELGGPECLDSDADRERAAQFFIGLERLARDGEIDDPAALERAFASPLKQPDPVGGSGIEIMTIHRAKGLEFETVILFGLTKRVRGPEPRALHWQQRLHIDGSVTLLLAPMSEAPNRLNEYLQRAEQARDAAEKARLLYVATTRARERLHIVARLPAGEAAPSRGSLLAYLWPEIGDTFRASARSIETSEPPNRAVEPLLHRFADLPELVSTQPDLFEPTGPDAAPASTPRPEFEWAGQTAALIGTVVHDELQRLAALDFEHCRNADLEARAGTHRARLAVLGVPPSELDRAAARVQQALRRVLEDPIGRWILGPRAEARSELGITVRSDALEHLRLDRTFVDAGVRWIIDFKTSTHEGADLDAFLDSEVERYRAQLERYARALGAFENRPIRVGLYFPLLGAFRDWAPRSGATPR